MGYIRYESINQYIDASATDLKTELEAWKAVKDAARNAMLGNLQQGAVAELMLNNGQSIIKTTYKTMNDLLACIDLCEVQIQQIVNKLNGRVSSSQSARNLLGGRFGY